MTHVRAAEVEAEAAVAAPSQQHPAAPTQHRRPHYHPHPVPTHPHTVVVDGTANATEERAATAVAKVTAAANVVVFVLYSVHRLVSKGASSKESHIGRDASKRIGSIFMWHLLPALIAITLQLSSTG